MSDYNLKVVESSEYFLFQIVGYSNSYLQQDRIYFAFIPIDLVMVNTFVYFINYLG